MHNFIYQLSDQPLEKQDWINQETFTPEQLDCADYLMDIDAEERRRILQHFPLPKRYFSRAEDGSDRLTYTTDLREEKNDWVRRIRLVLHQLEDEDGYKHADGYITSMRRIMFDMLDCWGDYFVVNKDGRISCPLNSTEFVIWATENLKVGDTLHICGVVDYHW